MSMCRVFSCVVGRWCLLWSVHSVGKTLLAFALFHVLLQGRACLLLQGACHPLPTIQEKTLHMDITRWSMLKSDWLYSLQPKMEKLYMVNKRVWNAVLGCNLKNDRICSFPRQTIQYHDNPSLCPNQYHWRSWSWTVLWRPTRPFRTNTQKRCPFHYRGLECKSRKSRNTWSNRQIWHWNTEWSRAKTYTPIIGAPK